MTVEISQNIADQSWVYKLLGAAVTGSAMAVSAAAYYLFNNNVKSDVEFYHSDLDNQSYEIEPGVWTSYCTKDGNLPEYLYEDAKTIYESLCRGLRVSNNGPYIGTRRGVDKRYEWSSYQQIYDSAQALGTFLVAKTSPSDKASQSIVGIFSQSREEFVITFYACNMYSLVLVPLYDTLGAEAGSYIVNQTEMAVCICDNEKKVKQLLQEATKTPNLKYIIVMDDFNNNSIQSDASRHSIQIITFQQALVDMRKDLLPPRPPAPDDVCIICYTSGTTGVPKGVVLSHKNIVSNVAGVQHYSKLSLCPDDVHLSYLPMAHMLEQVVQLIMTQHGGRIGFYQGDIKFLMDDLKYLRPTFFPTVPRLLNRMYDKIMQRVQGSRIKSWLLQLALNRKMALIKRGIITRNTIWDRLVFGTIQESLGGRVRFVVTGSAPLSPNVLNFVRCSFGCLVFEAYGQTEATTAVTFTANNEWQSGHVGGTLPCCSIKLADVPEMNYFAKDNKGEICVRGPTVMKEYYKDEERTREVLEPDGWLHTGDIAQFLPNGTVKIIDRKKHIFKLAQGEYIAPEKIESFYLRSRFVAQVFVDGHSLQTFTVGIVVPDQEVIMEFAKEKGINGSFSELCKNRQLNKIILEDIRNHGKEAGLKGFEQVRYIYLHEELFSLENDLLTPTFKSKRPALRSHFAKNIDDMYLLDTQQN